VQNDFLADLGVPGDCARAPHISPGGRLSVRLSLASARANETWSIHPFLPFEPLFRRPKPGGGRVDCLAITPAHRALTRYCFAPDHAAAHLKIQTS
jgi:hypothetical protein